MLLVNGFLNLLVYEQEQCSLCAKSYEYLAIYYSNLYIWHINSSLVLLLLLLSFWLFQDDENLRRQNRITFVLYVKYTYILSFECIRQSLVPHTGLSCFAYNIK